MSTDHTEMSRTSVGDFLKLVGDEVQRASAFLSKTGRRPAPATRPPRISVEVLPATTSAAPLRQQERAQKRGVDSFGSWKGLVTNSGFPGGGGLAGAPAPLASTAADEQEPFLVAGALDEARPATMPLNEVRSSHSAEYLGPAAAAVSSRSASFVRFSQNGPLLAPHSIRSAAAAAIGDLPAMPSMDVLHLSRTTASSAPSSSATSSSDSPTRTQVGRQQPNTAIMVPMPPLDALDLSHTTASSAPSTHSVGPQQLGDDGDGMEGIQQEPEQRPYHAAHPGPEPAPVPPTAFLQEPGDAAQPWTGCPAHQIDTAPRQGSSTGIQEAASLKEQMQERQHMGGGGYEPPARTSSVLKACQADLLKPLLPTGSAKVAINIDPQVRPSPMQCVTEQTERLGELKKSHVKVLRWLSQEQTPNYSPMAPSLEADRGPCMTALRRQPQQHGTSLGPPLTAPRASTILRAATDAQLRSNPMAADLAEEKAVSYAAASQHVQALPVQQPQQHWFGQKQTPHCTGRHWSSHYRQTPLFEGVHSEAVTGNPEQLHISHLQQEQPVLLRHSPLKVQQQRLRSALVRLPQAGLCGDDVRTAGNCKPQLRLLRALQPRSAALPQRRPHSAGCYPHLPVSTQNGPGGLMAGSASGLSAQQPQLALPWHGQPAVAGFHLQLPGGPGGISIGNIQTAYFGPTTLPATNLCMQHRQTTSCLQGGLIATEFQGQAAHAHSISSHGANQQQASTHPQPEMDLWSAYLATRATEGKSNMQDSQNVDPADAVGQLRAISSRIKHMQGEITTFLGSSHAPHKQQGLLLGAPSSSNPAPQCSEDRTAQADQMDAERASHQPRAGGSAEQELACQQPGVFDDDFVMSIKLGADYKTLQQQARNAALALAAGGTKPFTNHPQEPGGKAGAAGMPLGAAPGQATAGKNEAIDRLKGLRASRGTPRVQHDTSIPVMRMPGRRGA